MRLLRTYVLREHLAPFATTLGGLTAALLIGNIVKFTELVIAKGVSIFDILRLLIYLTPYMLSFTVPMACLIAMVMAFGRLGGDYELIAMRASGIAPARLVTPMVAAGLMLSMGVLALNDRVIPESHLAFRRQLKAIGVQRPTAYLEAGTFIKEFTPYIIFIYQIEGKLLSHVRIYEPKASGPTRTIVATRGEFEPPPKDGKTMRLKLYDGTIDEWDPEHPGSLYKVSFGTYTMNLGLDAEARGRLAKKLKEMTFRELKNEQQQLQRQSIPALPVSLEIHRRMASSFASIVFIVFGLAMGLGHHHHERLTTFVWVLGLFIAYYVTAIAVNALAVKHWLPAWLTMWLPNLVGLAIGLISLTKTVRR